MPQSARRTTKALDGSAADLARLLRELVQITTQADGAGEPPTLELQFGDIMTRTTLLMDNPMQCLLVLAQLPRNVRSVRAPRVLPSLFSAISAPCGLEMVWHADQGCYLAFRQMPVSDFTDEASVLDAILDTADRSRSWYIEALQQHSKAA